MSNVVQAGGSRKPLLLVICVIGLIAAVWFSIGRMGKGDYAPKNPTFEEFKATVLDKAGPETWALISDLRANRREFKDLSDKEARMLMAMPGMFGSKSKSKIPSETLQQMIDARTPSEDKVDY